MKTKIFSVLVLLSALSIVFTGSVQATILSPVTVTGFNRDIMYGPDGGTGGGYSGVAYGFFANGAITTGGITRNDGLPIGNFASLLDAAHTYSFAPAGGDTATNNGLYFPSAGAAQTLSLATPVQYDTIGVLACGIGVGNAALSFQLNYADGSQSTGLTYNASNYYNTAHTNAAYFFTRAGAAGTDTFVTSAPGNGYCLYETVVAADSSKTLQSITFSGPAASGYGVAVMAVSGHLVPEPSTLVLFGMGMLGLLCYAWKKRK